MSIKSLFFLLSFPLPLSQENSTVLERDTCVVMLAQNVANNPKIIHTPFDKEICKHSQAKWIFIT